MSRTRNVRNAAGCMDAREPLMPASRLACCEQEAWFLAGTGMCASDGAGYRPPPAGRLEVADSGSSPLPTLMLLRLLRGATSEKLLTNSLQLAAICHRRRAAVIRPQSASRCVG